MEGFGKEVVEVVVDSFNDDKKLVVDMLSYLYKNTTAEDMQDAIVDFFNAENVCLECGSEMEYYEYKEYHSEVEAYETMSTYLCPICDRDEKKGLK